MDSPMSVLLILVLLSLAVLLGYRLSRGYGFAKTVARDDIVLRSSNYAIVGKPDRIEKWLWRIVPVEYKSAAERVYESHRAQLLTYCLLIEECWGVRPPYGVVVLRSGKRVKVRFTGKAREKILEVAEQMRHMQRDLSVQAEATPSPGKCRACGQRQHCSQKV
jgi:CRISPR-associated exonuclease Cas4